MEFDLCSWLTTYSIDFLVEKLFAFFAEKWGISVFLAGFSVSFSRNFSYRSSEKSTLSDLNDILTGLSTLPFIKTDQWRILNWQTCPLYCRKTSHEPLWNTEKYKQCTYKHTSASHWNFPKTNLTEEKIKCSNLNIVDNLHEFHETLAKSSDEENHAISWLHRQYIRQIILIIKISWLTSDTFFNWLPIFSFITVWTLLKPLSLSLLW